MGRTHIKKHKIAFLVSHPIQYFSPLFKKLAERSEIDLTVLYCSDESVKGMRDSGFDSDVKWDVPLLEGYQYRFLKNNSPAPTICSSPFGLINFGVVKEIRRGRYDAVIIHGWHYVTLWLAYFAAVFSRIPVFLHAENPYNQEIRKAKWKLFIKKIVLGPFFKGFRGFLAIGAENRKFYEYYGVDTKKIFFTPYAVDNDRFIKEYERDISRKTDLKKEIGIPGSGTVILFSGKLVAKKRPMDLLQAYERIAAPDKALVFLGDGPLRRVLEEYAAGKKIGNVHITGFKNQSELCRYYIAADIFVMPSTMGETWGLAVNEAMCFGLPAIVSDLAGCGADLVRSGQNGYVFKTGDVSELARHLSLLSDDRDGRERFGRFSLEMIRSWNYASDIEGIGNALNS